MMVKELATAWAEALSRITGETNQYKIALARYMVESLFSMLLSFLVLIILGLLFGLLRTALLLTLVVMILKSVMGGLHLTTPLRCALVGGVMTIILSQLAQFLPFGQLPKLVQLWVFVLAIFIVWKKTPLEAKGKPLTTEQQKVLALVSRILIVLITVICWCWPQASTINLLFYGTFFQVLSLTKPLAWALAGIDRLLDRGYGKLKGILRIEKERRIGK
jgi:accessory gene regulator B